MLLINGSLPAEIADKKATSLVEPFKKAKDFKETKSLAFEFPYAIFPTNLSMS